MSHQNEILLQETLAYASVVLVGLLDKDFNVIGIGVTLAVVNLAYTGASRWWRSGRRRA